MSPVASPVYPFVPAAFDIYGDRIAPALALVIHMAEGGGTVGYLDAKPPLPRRGVSVHFVVTYAGLIVQMLNLGRISGSINPKLIRKSDDAPFVGYNDEVITFGATARKRILGQWSPNPNQAVITVEVEGFAAQGPNEPQRIALRKLSRDLAKRLPTIRGLLGHRDFQSYKACPGKHINWAGMYPTLKHG